MAKHTFWDFTIHDGYYQDLRVGVGDEITWYAIPGLTVKLTLPAFLGLPEEVELDDTEPSVTRTVAEPATRPDDPEGGYHYTVLIKPGNQLVKGPNGTRPRILVGPGGVPPGSGRRPGPGGESGEEVDPDSVGVVDTSTWVLANEEGGNLTAEPGQKVEWLPAEGYTLEFRFPTGLFGVGSGELPPKGGPLVMQLLGDAKTAEYVVVAQPGGHEVKGPDGGRPRIIISVSHNPPPSRRGGSGGPKSTRAKPGGGKAGGARGRG